MKKLFLFLLVLYIANTAWAQSSAFGIKGGLNTTWLLNQNYNKDLKVTLGHMEGITFVWYGIPLNYYNDRLYGIGVDVLHATHNQDYKGQITVSDSSGSRMIDYTRSVRLSYVDIPLYFRLASDQGATYFEIGPQYSILLSATESFATPDDAVESFIDRDVKELTNPNAWAFMIGYGFDFPVVERNIFITAGARLIYSFTDLTKHRENGSTDYKPTKRAAGGLNLSVVYRFNSYHSSKAKVSRRR